jgi:hypothetical protein
MGAAVDFKPTVTRNKRLYAAKPGSVAIMSRMRILSAVNLDPNEKQNNRANERHEKTSRMKGRSGRRFRKEPSNQTTHDGAGYTQKSTFHKPQILSARDEHLSKPTDNRSDNDGPDDV